MVEDDDNLLDRCREGDNDAFLQFYRAYEQLALRTAVRHGAPDPEDVAQEAFIKIWRAFQNGKGPTDKPGGYVMTAVRNVAISRHSGNVTVLPITDYETVAAVELDSSIVDDTPVLDALRGLPPLQAAAGYQAWIEGRDLTDIAQRLQLPTPNAAAKHIQRARTAIGAALHNRVRETRQKEVT